MNNLIERYIYDVTRRLPKKERGEITRELEASITDMLPDKPSDQDITDVLTNLGAPHLLAEQYRQKPRYLISPAIFDTYISVLKTVTLIVGVVFGCLGAILALSSGSIGEIILGGAGMAYTMIMQTALWITMGFVIAERFNGKEKWSPSDLPQLPTGIKISRSSSIVGMIMSVFFPLLFIALIIHGESFMIFMRNMGTHIINPLSQTAMERFIPYLVTLGVFGLVLNGLKLYWAKWNISLCVINTIFNVVWAGFIIYALNWPDLLNTEFLEFMNSISVDVNTLQKAGTMFSVFLIIIASIDLVSGILNTWKSVRKPV